MTRAAFAIPGDIELPTGGYMYDRRVLALLPQSGIEARHLPLPGSFPDPTLPDLEETARVLASVPADEPILIDGLAYGAMPRSIVDAAKAPIVALVHHPLCLETGLSDARRRTLRALETDALEIAGRVVVTSDVTRRTLIGEFAVPERKITVAEPGTDPAPRAVGSRGGPLHLLSVGSVVPRKAFDLLVRALGTLRDAQWRLTIAGPIDRNAESLAALHAAIADTGLEDRIAIVGAVDSRRLAALYTEADVFIMASLYEGYGMVLAEAMARGLPIVCTTGGAAAETVPDAAALKVPPADKGALALAIGRVVGDAALRGRLADASWSAGQKLPRWEDTARIIAGVIREAAT